MPMNLFHPVVASWFERRFNVPTDAQRLSWPKIVEGGHTLLAAPTGSGKTLAAFMVCIDRLLRQSLEGELPDATEVIYVSPLKALSNDIRRNLEVPLKEIHEEATAQGFSPDPLRVTVQTRDTPASERQAMLRRPPHILVTTPESLYLLLTGPRSRENLRKVRTVIVDEIHALARDKRGSHLALSLARLDALCDTPPVRIGLSATQRPIDEIARFLVGTGNLEPNGDVRCHIVDTGHVRQLDLAVEVPPTELSAVCSMETWAEIYARISELVNSHRSTLIFVNTRRMAERVCHHLEELLGEGHVASHHGSLSREIRLNAEERLKNGELKAIVATASLELGIDIGYIDLVCQIGSPRSIATFLQRVGRAGHSLGLIPKGRFFALTRDELSEGLALVRAVRQGRLDRIEIPIAPLDILSQQIVATVANEEWDEEALFELCRKAWPFRDLPRKEFDAIVEILSEGIAPGNRTGIYLHRDRIYGKLRTRRGARITAVTSGGAIPEVADYRVVTIGDGTFVGTLNEDFAIESNSGDIFLLGNSSWRVVYVRGGEVTVDDAHGAPATIPFWLGEAPGRTIELSAEFSDFREVVWEKACESPEGAVAWLKQECGADDWGAQQTVEYVSAQGAAIGLVPSQRRVVFERFFDESGGMQLVIHAPFGTRINRAWGLALRKCFCRNFDFELQASADDNGIVLSVGPNQSFPLERMFALVDTQSAEDVLIQALLAVPMFLIRWRWNTTRALMVLRNRGGKKVPPPLQRFKADDLLTAVFPMQTACFEHRTGDLEVPDNPLVRQTVYDCLHEAMDLTGWMGILREIEAGRIELVARDTREPSPFSHQLLNAQPYAFLDDAPLEERRARAVATRRTIRADDVRDLARLDPAAIDQVRSEAWPLVRDAEELHDTLLTVGALQESEGSDWKKHFADLVARGRATTCKTQNGPLLWIAAEQWPAIQAAFPGIEAEPAVTLPESLRREVTAEQARLMLVRGRVEISGPTYASRIARELGLEEKWVQLALEQLEIEGFVLRGEFTRENATPQTPTSNGTSAALVQKEVEWCERRLLARIHRLTLDGLRRQVQPVKLDAFFRFVLARHAVKQGEHASGAEALGRVIASLQGFETPAGAWERDILPQRLKDYDPQWLDELFHRGEVIWGRLQPRKVREKKRNGQVLTRVAPISLMRRADLAWLLPTERQVSVEGASSNAQVTYEALVNYGALFFSELLAASQLLPSQLEEALGELATLGLVTADGFGAIRSIASKRKQSRGHHARAVRSARRRMQASSQGGRWSRFPPFIPPVDHDLRIERWAWQLLERYGVMFRDLLARESCAPAWRDLAAVYRRLEARGEIRGGRFIGGVAGEQFALASSVDQLRKTRDEQGEECWRMISAADPLNLIGVVTEGARVPATVGNRLLFVNGEPTASRESGQVRWLREVDKEAKQRALRMLYGPDGMHRAKGDDLQELLDELRMTSNRS